MTGLRDPIVEAHAAYRRGCRVGFMQATSFTMSVLAIVLESPAGLAILAVALLAIGLMFWDEATTDITSQVTAWVQIDSRKAAVWVILFITGYCTVKVFRTWWYP